MKLKNCLTGIVLLVMNGYGQLIKPLSIGDAMPTIEINSIFNYPALQSNLSDFKDKLVILDFMATTCLGCIEALPRLDSLQKEYGDKIQIILVSYEKKERVATFLQKSFAGKQCHLPIIAGDTVFSKIFPHIYIPHAVWIKNNTVKAITKSSYVKRNNVQQILNDAEINWPVKNDMPLYDYNKSLLGADQQKDFNFIITHFINDASYKHSMLIDTIGRSVRTRLFDLPVIQMYLRTYGLDVFLESFIVLEVKNTNRYIYDKNNSDWRKENTYCYEKFLPIKMNKKTAGEKMRSDLDNYFALQGRIEKRKMLCNIISRRNVHASFIVPNYSLHAIVSTLNSRYNSMPYLNESGFNGKIFLDPPVRILSEENKVLEALKKQGFDITQAMREVSVFVISEK